MAEERFRAIAGEELEVDPYELKKVLDGTLEEELGGDVFTLDACRSMVAMRDVDYSGKLRYQEFMELWQDIQAWKGAFDTLDKDRSGYFNKHELHEALSVTGLSMSGKVYDTLLVRYSNKEGNINFQDFIACMVRLKTMVETFKAKDEDQTNDVTFSTDEFIQMSIYS